MNENKGSNEAPLGKFRVVNEAFECAHCKKLVPPAGRTCRNHCPFCLHSMHVDIFPGDRSHHCRGLLVPIAYEESRKKGLMIWFRCEKCSGLSRNIALLEDPIQADSYDEILKLSGQAPHPSSGPSSGYGK